MVSLIIAMWMTLRWRDASLCAWQTSSSPKLLFLSGKACPLQDLSITVDNSTVSLYQSAKNFGMTVDNTLSFSANINAVIHSCKFMHYNILKV
jgi:hypothetical protein